MVNQYLLLFFRIKFNGKDVRKLTLKSLIHKFKIDDTYIVLDINSGAVHKIDKITYEILDYYPEVSAENIIEKLSNKYNKIEIIEVLEELDQLMEEGLLFSQECYSEVKQILYKDKAIKAMCLHIAHDCNISCRYCFASQGNFKGQRILMSSEIGRKSIDFLVRNSGNRRNLEVDFFGGEPLMNFDVVKDIVNYGRTLEKKYNKHFRFTITTNAMLLTEEIMDYINENMDNIVLSIDGDKKTNDYMRRTINGEGTYDIILPKITRMIEKRGEKSYYVRGTFTKHNINFSKDVIHLAEQGFKHISVEPVVTEPDQEYALEKEELPTIFEEYEILAKEYLNRKGKDNEFSFFHFMIDLSQGPCIYKRLSGCGAGNEYIAVTPEGDVYPCHQFVGNHKFKMGSVLEEELDNRIQDIFIGANVLNKDKCNSCWTRFYCSGGCHANAFNFNKDVLIPHDIGCEMEKKRLECALMIQAHLFG